MRFKTTSKQKCSNLRTLLFITFPQGFRISKNIGHPTFGSGGKKTFKRYLKSEHTDRRTDRRTDGNFNQRADALKIPAYTEQGFTPQEAAERFVSHFAARQFLQWVLASFTQPIVCKTELTFM